MQPRFLPGPILLAAVLLAACSAPDAEPPLKRVVVEQDDFIVTESCEIVIPPGLVIDDKGAPGVIQVRTSGVRVRFAEGTELRGAMPDQPWNLLTGCGIRVVDAADVVLENLRVHGFRAAVWASGSDGLTVQDADLSDNFRQRLGSTPLAEDSADWLWPHQNDANQWLENYGAAVYLEDGAGATVRRVRVRRGQNGIILDNMQGCSLYDNDCSFLSGWGLAMWRSSGNTISRNALDFCVRGYSHGVYNRGQDSAGILMFEQCNDNLIAENSVTHGGDGFFGFAGREALGEEGEHDAAWYQRRGNNRNVLVGNDFSYAPAHGIEMTFSFDNVYAANRIVGNAICGIWGGYSQDSLIQGNEFADNGGAGYGLERGAINIDRSRGNRILDNDFRGNRAGVHIWSLPTAFSERAWGQANDLTSTGTLVAANRFEGDELVLHGRGDCEFLWGENRVDGVDEERRLEEGARVVAAGAVELPPLPDLDALPGETRPVGARPELRGRENIIVGPWGPWDHEEKLLLVHTAAPDLREYQAMPPNWKPEVVLAEEHEASVMAEVAETEQGGWVVRFRNTASGLHRFAGEIRAGELSWPVGGWLLTAEWQARFFPWTIDPREDLAGWRAEAAGGADAVLGGLELHYDHGGPVQQVAALAEAGVELGADRFGTIASTSVPLPAGRYRLRTLSDDGIRVLVDGETVIEDWSWHAPKEIIAGFEVEADREVRIEVEHFEIDGFAKLVVGLERVG